MSFDFNNLDGENNPLITFKIGGMTETVASVEEIRVFIASPSDVEEERDVLEKVIKNVNQSFAGLEPIQLRLVRWEDTVQPAVGGDPQEIINSQVAGNYEVFIGILWTRFGTPTPRSDSGTLEEFEAAMARYREDTSSVVVMFYFKDTPRAPTDIDPEQLKKVQEFRSKYGQEGIYGTFTDIRSFESTLQIHLTRLVVTRRKGIKQSNITLPPNEVIAAGEDEDDSQENHDDSPVPQESDDDLGFLDLVEEGEKCFNEGIFVLKRIEKHIRELGDKMEDTTEDLDASINQLGKYKKIVNALADDMERIAIGIQAELIPLKNTYETGIKVYGQAASLLPDFGEDSMKQLESSISETSTFERGVGKAQEALLGLKNAIAGTPRITSKYNKAKKRILEVLGELDREMSAIRTSTKQTLQLFEELYGSIER